MKKEEQETILRYDALEDKWFAWSCIPKHIYAMKKKGWTQKTEMEEGSSFEAPVHAVRISSAEKPQRKPMSEEQRQDMIKRFAAYREQQKTPENMGEK